MTTKIFRDPLYNYVSIDRSTDEWLIRLLDSREVQRLRRVHQLGISNFTYPGAEHSRLSHSLGVLHLMQVACDQLLDLFPDAQVRSARPVLLAAALLHDVGHGPFSHVFEPCLNVDHEEWSKRIILNPECECHKILAGVDRFLPQRVADLIDPHNHDDPSWMKYLLSSQLDVDRLDYLRRDSFFSGAGYGHYDWYRILNSFRLFGNDDADRTIVWPIKSAMAVEEYVFARYYMYQNVYLHKTTRGFEKMLVAMWERARSNGADDADLVPAIKEFWSADSPSVSQYLAIEEFTVLQQIQAWTKHADPVLQDLATRFLSRQRFAAIDAPNRLLEIGRGEFSDEEYDRWDKAVGDAVTKHGFDASVYCLRDTVKPKYHQPYLPEKEGDEQSAKNAIRILVNDDSDPVEITQLCPRLQPLTYDGLGRVRHFVPQEAKASISVIRNSLAV
ncbi:MAG: phosphohydrolase [Planctomycetota bacterium]|nr:MAG: phosphohydrolase [Planctomycetota bacterium]